jgi:hypothetical protein
MSSVPYPAGTSGSMDSITNGFVVTPSDDDDLATVPRVLILSDAATVTMDLVGGASNVAVPLQAGFNPIRPSRIYATGTDAVTIFAGW